MNSFELRSRFFSFFKKYNHPSIASSPVIPAQDPTLLFTNAGMNQFKDLFLGLETREYKRAVTIQKCIRAGGKHNDLDNVGFTKRHLTFFEMMGNFSFGDYFKKEAIVYAWNFLTKEVGLPIEKLHATVFETDNEAFDIWNNEIGLPVERIHRLGAETNFWQMGDTGPCGPCSEIFIDRGLAYGSKDDTPATDSDRFLEIWNLVFMQYDRSVDGTLKPLKQTGVDTGMGLERLALVVQNVDSVFHTDLFMPLIMRIEVITGRQYKDGNDELKAAFHVLADHIRSTVFLIAQGLVPSNEGRGYVLRKIIRRAALFAQKLKKEPFFCELVSDVVMQFDTVYPDLKLQEKRVYQTIIQETEKFSINLMRGTVLLNELFQTYQKERVLPGKQVFKLYDTFGFPVELITAEARHKGFSVDMAGFDSEMAQQKDQSGKKIIDALATFEFESPIITEFTGYNELTTESVIVSLIATDREVVSVDAGQEVYVVAQKSPFFIVGGGQVPDQGVIVVNGKEALVQEARYIGSTAIALKITGPCGIKVGDLVIQKVDSIWRRDAMKNHTATHLLQAALMERYGAGIKQSGSLVHPDYLRFDFTFSGSIAASDLHEIEQIVNTKIMDCI
jgi:alanyl-tRNA synthetase